MEIIKILALHNPYDYGLSKEVTKKAIEEIKSLIILSLHELENVGIATGIIKYPYALQ